jgi:hypothetical protein
MSRADQVPFPIEDRRANGNAAFLEPEARFFDGYSEHGVIVE